MTSTEWKITGERPVSSTVASVSRFERARQPLREREDRSDRRARVATQVLCFFRRLQKNAQRFPCATAQQQLFAELRSQRDGHAPRFRFPRREAAPTPALRSVEVVRTMRDERAHEIRARRIRRRIDRLGMACGLRENRCRASIFRGIDLHA
jgi:hypothetical protein